MTTWNNSDGLLVSFGLDEGKKGLVGKESTMGAVQELAIVVEASRLSFAGGLVDPRSRVGIPARSFIESAKLYVTEAFDSGSSATLAFGLANADGTETNLNLDGLIEADEATEANMDTAGKVVTGAGAYIGTYTGSVFGYPYVIMAESGSDAPFTTGKGILIVRYIPQVYTDQDA